MFYSRSASVYLMPILKCSIVNMKCNNFLVSAMLLMASQAQSAVFNIEISISSPQSSVLSGTVEVSDSPNSVSSSGGIASPGTIFSFPLLNLELSNSSVSQSFNSSDLSGYSFEFIQTSFGTLEFFGRVPLPTGTIGLSGPHEIIDSFEWDNLGGSFVIPPVGVIDVTDFQFVGDFNFLPAGGAGVIGPVSIDDLFDDSVGDAAITSLTLVPEPGVGVFLSVGIAACLLRRRSV